MLESELVNTLLKDFEEHGASAIYRLVEENPAGFLWLIADLVCDVHEYVEVTSD